MKSLLGAASLTVLLMTAPAWAQNSSQNSQKLSTQDKTFIKGTESANLAQVELGQLAEQKAAKPAVKELGRWIATDDSFANKRLMKLAEEAGYDQKPMLTEKDKALKQQLKGASGQQFDQQYLKEVIQAEKKGVHQFKTEAQDGENAKIKTYAGNLAPVVHQHLTEAQEFSGSTAAMSGGTTPPQTSPKQ